MLFRGTFVTKKFLIVGFIAVGPGLPLLGASPGSVDTSCIKLTPKAPIAYVPFSNLNPKTNALYLPKDKISLPLQQGKKEINALEYISYLNNLEADLNEKGYTLRDQSIPTEAFQSCFQLKDQTISLDESEFTTTDLSLTSYFDEYSPPSSTSTVLGSKSTFLSGNPAKEVEFPEIPPLDAEPKVSIDASKLEVKFDRSWLFEYGDPKQFYTSVNPYVNVAANRQQAIAQAGAKWRGAFMGQWNGELAHVYARAETPGAGALKADLALNIIDGKQVWAKPLLDTKPFALGDRYVQALSKAVTYRFAVGPIPMKAEVGVRGEVGFKWQVKLFPLQAGAFAAPWIGADVYAQAGGDIIAAGGGVGGRLILVKDSLVMEGNATLEKQKKFKATLSADVTNNMLALAGELYAFAYAYYPSFRNLGQLERWNTKIVLYNYKGYEFNKNIFNFNRSWEF